MNNNVQEKTIVLTYVGSDSFNRPVYKEADEKLWKDVDPRPGRKADLCTVYQNSFDGEPDTPMSVMSKYEGVTIEFNPKRITW